MDKVFTCDCGSFDHQLGVYASSESLHFIIRLRTHRNIFKRIISGVKYIFGYKSRYGDFDEFILSDSHKKELALRLFSEDDRYTIHNALGTQYTFLKERATHVRDVNGYDSDLKESYNVKKLQNVFENSNQDFWNEHEMTDTKPYGKFLF